MRLRIFTEPQQGASYATLRRVAKATEDLGFDAFFRSDHYLKMGGASGEPGPSDAWATLAGLAVETSRIRLGTLVTSATFRYPGPLAIAVAGIDEMSGGRVELGLGAGWYEGEHAAYGIPFPPTGERFDRLEEQLAIITGLWETPAGEKFSYEGTYYQVADSPALPKPVQRPRPPVIIGGHGPRRTPALAARYADEFNIAFSNAGRRGRAVRPGQGGVRRGGPRRRTRWSTPPPRWSAAARTRPRCPAAPRRIGRDAGRPARQRPGRLARRDRRQDRHVRRGGRADPLPAGPRPRRPRPPGRHRRRGAAPGVTGRGRAR